MLPIQSALGFFSTIIWNKTLDGDFLTVLTDSLSTKDITDKQASSLASMLLCSQDAVSAIK